MVEGNVDGKVDGKVSLGKGTGLERVAEWKGVERNEAESNGNASEEAASA